MVQDPTALLVDHLVADAGTSSFCPLILADTMLGSASVEVVDDEAIAGSPCMLARGAEPRILVARHADVQRSVAYCLCLWWVGQHSSELNVKDRATVAECMALELLSRAQPISRVRSVSVR